MGANVVWGRVTVGIEGFWEGGAAAETWALREGDRMGGGLRRSHLGLIPQALSKSVFPATRSKGRRSLGDREDSLKGKKRDRQNREESERALLFGFGDFWVSFSGQSEEWRCNCGLGLGGFSGRLVVEGDSCPGDNSCVLVPLCWIWLIFFPC